MPTFREPIENLMHQTIGLAYRNVVDSGGGPFAAMIVKNGSIVSTGVNRVTSLLDPTAHAEIMAIREACRLTEDFCLSGMEIYTTCEPCPMCLGAIYWARLDRIYYAATRIDAAESGFDDALIYTEIGSPVEARKLPMRQVLRSEARKVMDEWKSNPKNPKY